MTIRSPVNAGTQVSRFPHDGSSKRAKSTDGRIVFAVGDIHGCYVQLSALLEAIVEDIAAVAGNKQSLLIFCGDYVDRGPQSADVLSALVWLSRHPTLDVVFLRGNHETLLLDFLDHPKSSLPWLLRDGKVTLMSYGIDMLEIGEDTSSPYLANLRDQLMDNMPASHLQLLRHLPTKLVCGDYVFVHAGLKPGISIERQTDEDCLWIREEFLTTDYPFKKVVVHGHSWNSAAPVVTANRVGIDTGAYSTGVLTAVRLDGADITFLQSRIIATETFGLNKDQPENVVRGL